jgi:hypothetical protein
MNKNILQHKRSIHKYIQGFFLKRKHQNSPPGGGSLSYKLYFHKNIINTDHQKISSLLNFVDRYQNIILNLQIMLMTKYS